MDETAVIRKNLKTLSSPEVREVAMTESVGGNAGPGCYVLNLEVDPDGRILYAGNDPKRTNVSIRVFAAAFFRSAQRVGELILDVHTSLPDGVKRRVACSAWLWNLHRKGSEKEFLERFLEGKLDWPGLVELLRTKYPNLAPDLKERT